MVVFPLAATSTRYTLAVSAIGPGVSNVATKKLGITVAAGGGASPEDFAGGAGGPTGGASAGPEYVNPGGNGGNAAPGGGGSTVDADFKVVDDDK